MSLGKPPTLFQTQTTQSLMLLLVFAVTLFIAVLLSCRARETVLSLSVLFLTAGFALGEGVFGAHTPNREFLYQIAELALYSVLFTGGINTGGLKSIRRNWREPGRALLIGMPLTIVGTAMLAHWLMQMNWTMSFLIGSVLAPTDPVFVSGLFRFEAVPKRVKHVLNVESGLNDGLALPAVLIILNMAGKQNEGFGPVLWELVLGTVIGIGIPAIGVRLEKSHLFGAAGLFQRLNAFALGLIVLAVAEVTNANLFLAAFSAGVTIATLSQPVTKAFHEFGELIGELLKLAALLIFGARIAPVLFAAMPWSYYVFAGLAVFAVRPVAILISFFKSGAPRREVLTIGWFGPKGFASVVYALMVLNVGTSATNEAARVTGLAVAASILIYSSTDILVGRRFERQAKASQREQEAA